MIRWASIEADVTPIDWDWYETSGQWTYQLWEMYQEGIDTDLYIVSLVFCSH